MRTLFTLLYCLLLTGPFSLFSQSNATIRIADVIANCEGTIVVPVTIETDITLISYQFSIDWEDPILNLVSVTPNTMNGGSFSSGIGSPPQPDKVGVSWSKPQGQPFTAGTVLFTLTFNITAPTAMPSPLVFAEVPTNTELLAPGVMSVNLVPDPGSVFVNGNSNGVPIIPDCPTADVNVTANPGATSANVTGIGITPSDCEALTTTYTLTGDTQRSGTGTNASGSFNLGTTQVTYTVSDGTNTVTCQFNVNVTTSNSSADLEIYTVASDADCNDQTGYIDVFVNNFQDIGSLDFSFTWDPSVIQLDAANPTDQEALPAAFIGPDPAQPGRFSFSWAEANHPGFPNNPTKLLRINFIIVGNAGESTPFTFSNSPSTEAFSNSTLSAVPVTTTGTTFTISGDNNPPTITNCPSGVITATTMPGENAVIVSGIGAAAMDNCGTVNISYTATNATPGSGNGDLNNTAFNIGTTNVTYTFSDGTNQTSCSFQVVVESGNPDPIILSIGDIGTINCQTGQISIDVLAENFTNVGSLQFTLNLSNESAFNFFSISNIAFPNAYQGPTGTNIDNPAAFTWVDVQGMNFPNGSGVLFTLTFDILGNPGESSLLQFTDDPTQVEALYTNLDEAVVITNDGNLAIDVDNVNPVITCPANDIVECGENVTPASTGMATATDNCNPTPTITFSDNNSNVTACGTGTIVRTWTANDGNNTVTCNQTITINPKTINAVCIANTLTVTLDVNNTATIAAANINNGSNGGCGVLTPSVSPNTFDCTSLGNNTVTLTVTDECGAMGTCTATVNVRPNSNGSDQLSITCPDDITITCNELTNPATTGTAIATDVCSTTTPTVTFSDDNSNLNNCGVGTITRTWMATNGNVTQTCTQTITIITEPIIANCQNISVQLDGNGMATVTGMQLNNNSTGGCGNLAFTASMSTFGCSDIGDNAVTLTVRDECGSTQTCTAIVTVLASNGGGGGQLMITCPEDITITCNQLPAPAVTGTATATNDCSGTPPTVTFSDNNSNLNNCGVGSIIRTWMVTNGNDTQTCTQIITITQVPIVANCKNVRVQLDENDAASITAADVNSNSTGGCGTLDFAIDINTFNCSDVGENAVTLTVTDECGSSTTCISNVTIQLNGAIMMTCPADITVQCNASISPNVTGTATAIDACNNEVNDISFVDNPANGGDCAETITRTWTARDVSNNTETCTQIITVVGVAIVANCQNIIINLDANGMASITGEQINASSAGGCGTLSYSVSPNSFNTSNIGGNNVTLTVTDECGSAATCTAVVTVQDPMNGTPPSIQCPNPVTTITNSDDCSAQVSGIALVVNSPQDEIASIAFTLTGATQGSGIGDASGIFNVGTTTVTYTANGTNGQSSSCSFTVTVTDRQAPNFNNCPNDISLNIQAGSCDTLVSWIEPTTTDNCAVAGVMKSHEPGDSFSVGTTTVTYIVTDLAGNTDTCRFEITILEPVPPTIECLDNIVVANDLDSCNAVVTWMIPEATDNCGMVTLTNSHLPGQSFPIGTTTITHTATDISGNTATCTFDLTVNDEQAPVFINCPSDFVLEVVTEGVCDTMVDWPVPTVIDNCPGSVILTTSHQPNGNFPIGTTTVEYIATDAAGNADTCRFLIIVMGNSIQNDFCPADINQANDAGECAAVVNWNEPLFSSDCSSLTIESSHNAGDIFPVGTTTVEYIAADTFGNMDTCRFDVIVQDTEMPTIGGCPRDTTISVGQGSCITNYFWAIPTINDNCGLLEVTATHSPGEIFNIGETEVVYTIRDVNGNVTFCRFTIQVEDNGGPAINCPQPVEVSIDGSILTDPSMIITNTASDDCNSVSIEFNTPTANDDCSSVTVTQTDNTGLMSGSTFPVGTTTLQYTATDTFNNTTTCNVVISVFSFDVIEPTITDTEPCVGEFVKFSVDEVDGGVYTWFGPDGSVYDGAILSIEMIGFEDAGMWTVTIVDANGCTTSGTFFITVYATPNVTASASRTLFCGIGDENLQLMAMDAANAGVTTWAWQTPNRGVIFEQNPLISNIASEDAGLYIVTGITEQGCMAVDTIEINVPGVNGPILPTLLATPNNICLGDDVVLTGSSYFGNAVQYHWAASPIAGSGINDINANVNLITPTAVGDYTYHYWITDGSCSTDTAMVMVHVEQPAPITIQRDGEISCVDGTSSITLTAMTDLLVANASSVTCTWTYPDGSTANPGAVLILENVTSAQTGNYEVECLTANGCRSTKTIFLDISDRTDTPNLNAEEEVVCLGESIMINVLTQYAPTANYQWTAVPMAGSGLPGIVTPTNLEVTPTMAGTYTYNLVVTMDGCISEMGSTTVTVASNPVADLSTMPTMLDCIAAGTSLTLVESSGTGTTWTWITPRGTFVGNNIVLENITSADAGTYSVTIGNAAGCFGETASTVISISGALAAPSIKGPEAICEGEDISGEMFCITTPIPGATYTWTGPGGVLNATGPCLVINNVTAFNSGTYSVVCQLNGCSSSTSEDFNLVVLDAPNLENDALPAFIGLSTVFDATDNDNLSSENFKVEVVSTVTKGVLINEGDGSFTYTPNPGEFGPDNFIYEICYNDCPENCDIATVSLDIQFANDECIPTTVVSPNNDGKNDRFIITCLESDLFPDNSVVIYNRWGDQVYQAAPYQNDWRATYKGETLPDGTYYFVFMRTPNDPDPIKSYITVYK